MSDIFLTRFLNVALEVTQADRGTAVDRNMEVLAAVNILDHDPDEPNFGDFARSQLGRAIEDGQTIITNNIITDPRLAPKTNTALANLRFVVVIPVKDFGAVYLDRLIRHGIIPRDIIDKLNQVVRGVPAGKVNDVSEDDMLDMFYRLP